MQPNAIPLLFSQYTYVILYACKGHLQLTPAPAPRSSRKSPPCPPSVQGRISSYKNVRKNGTSVTYHNLQWWADGRNHALFIPADKVPQIKEAIKQGKKMQKLVRELSLADAQEIIASGSALKKSSRTSS